MTLVFITGASSGLGAALAALYDGKKIPTFLVGRDEKKLQNVQNQLTYCQGTLSADLAVASGRQKTIEALRKVNPSIVINNAGFGVYGKAWEKPQQSEMLDVNCKAPLELTLAAISLFQENGKPGTILNVSSIAGELANPLLAVYGATKAFLTNLSQALDFELKGTGIRVLVSLPGMIETPFASRAAAQPVHVSKWMQIKVSKVAEEIYWQIERKKEVHLIDFRYKLAFFLMKILPASLIKQLSMRSIEERL